MNATSRSPRFLLLVFMFALALVNTIVVLTIYHLDSRIGGGDIELADRFMKAIEIGSGLDPEGADSSGYEEAWSLLSTDCRDATAYGEFLAFFESQITDHGFVQSWRRSPEETGGMGDRMLHYLVDYEDLDGKLVTIRYDLRVLQRDSGYEIASYAAVPVSESGE